jgi:hypothetical protein
VEAAEPPPFNFNSSACTSSSSLSAISFSVINCGRGGLRHHPSRLTRYLESVGLPDLVLFTEAHLRPASAPSLEGYALIWQPRSPHVMCGDARGGVAFAVSHASTAIATVEIVDVYSEVDVSWMRVECGGLTQPLFVAAVYLPPDGGDRTCVGECPGPQCKRAHVQQGLHRLATDVKKYGGLGCVLLAGDFNVRAQNDASPRWLLVQQSLLIPQRLVVRNPVTADGQLQPTRQDPVNGTESVLDLVMSSEHNAGVVTCVLDPNAAISDHYPIHGTILQQSVSHSAALDASGVPKHFGFQSAVPSHLRGSHRIVTPPPPAGLTQFVDAIAQRWAADFVDTPSVGQLERWLMLVSEQCGLVKKKDKVPESVRLAVRAQRAVDTLKLRIHLALARHDPPAVTSSLTCQLEAATIKRDGLLKNRRSEQRRKRALKRQRARDVENDLDGPWLRTDPFTFADRAGHLQRGHTAHRSTRHHTPLRTLQLKLWQLQQDLATKYQCDGDDSRAQRWLAQLDRDVADGQCVDTHYVPTAVDVQHALSRLKAGADAIGLPVAVLKRTCGTLAFDSVVAVVQDIWRTGAIPDSFQLARVHLIYKSGPPHLLSSHRTIGICSAMSRLFQTTLEMKLMTEVAHQLSPAQYGFLRHKATELCVFVAEAATFVARVDGATVDSTFLDIKGAFPTTRHDHIHAAMRAYGVSVSVRRLLINWYARQRLFLQLGRLISDEVMQWLGVTEGSVFSPLVYVVVIDPVLHRLHSLHLSANMRIGIPILSTVLTLLFYADDGRVFGLSPPAMQEVLDSVGEGFGALDYVFNAAVTKSAIMRCLPIPKQARATARRQEMPEYTLSGVVLPTTSVYKYLGVDSHANGPRASQASHNRRLGAVLAAVQRQASSSSLAALPLIHCRSIYLTYWWPKVMYAAGLLQTTVPSTFQQAESRVLRYFTSAWQHPAVVLRSMFGVPTVQTRLDLDRLRLLFRLLKQQPGGLERCALTLVVMQYNRAVHLQSWWHRTDMLLRTMDRVCAQPAVRGGLVGLPASWLTWATEAAMDCGTQFGQTLDSMHKVARKVMLEVEAVRRRQDITTAHQSLTEVADLLDTPNLAPFLCLQRGPQTATRIQLWGGRRTLFSYDFFHLAACPWCCQCGQFTIQHLLRDCHVLENDRRIALTEAAAFLRAKDLLRVGDIDVHRNEWYRLMVGAPVSNAIFSLQLDTPTHFARPESMAATAHLRRNLLVYRGVLSRLDAFMLPAISATRERLQLLCEVLLYTPPRHMRMPRINHAHIPSVMALAGEEGPEATSGSAVPPPLGPVPVFDIAVDPTAWYMTADLGQTVYVDYGDGSDLLDVGVQAAPSQ